MKKLIFLFVAACFAFSATAQNNAITKYFSDYQSEASFTKVNVSSKMFSLFTEIDGEDEVEQAVLDAMSKLKGVKALVAEAGADASKLYTDALQRIAKDGSYEELMSVQDNEENIMFMIRNNGDIIAELLMIMQGADDFVVMSLFGEIDLNQIAKISRILKIAGIEEFGKLSE